MLKYKSKGEGFITQISNKIYMSINRFANLQDSGWWL